MIINNPDNLNDPNKERAESVSPIKLGSTSSSETSEMKQDALIDKLVSRFEEYEDWRKPYENLWNEVYKLYFSVPEIMKTATRARIFIPVVFQVVEAAVPKFVNLLFGQAEFFETTAIEPKNQPMADVVQVLLKYQLNQADFFVKFVDFAKQLILYGTSYFKVYWKVERKWVWSRIPIREAAFSIMGFNLGSRITGWEEKKEYKIVERRPEVEVLDILDVFPDPNATDEKSGRGIFIRYWMHIDEIKQMGQGKYPVFANTESEKLTEDVNNTDYVQSRQFRHNSRGISYNMKKPGMVEVLEWWGADDLDGDKINEETHCVVANRKVLLKAGPNNFHHQKRPVIRGVLFPVPKEWYGVGLVEPVISLQHELNTLRRQRLDNVNLILNRMWKVVAGSDVDLETLVSTPNGIILVGDQQDVMDIPTDNVTASAYNEAAIVQSDIENTTAPKSIQGTPESGRLGRTARGAQLIIGQALEKFSTGTKLLEDMAIEKVLRMFHQLNLQFIDEDDVFRSPGMYGHLYNKEITVEMLRTEVDFEMIGVSDMVGKEGKINQMISYLGVFKDVLDPSTIEAIAKEVWKLMGFNTDDIQIVGTSPVPGVGTTNIDQSLTAQAATNPPGVLPAIPGVGLPNQGR